MAASEAGVLPRDALAPLVEALADIPQDVRQQNEQILQRVEVLILQAEVAAKKPLLTSYQIQHDILPKVMITIRVAMAVLLVVVLLGGIGLGVGVAWWVTPRLQCGDQADGARVCYYYVRPPAPVAPTPQRQSAPAPTGLPK